MADTTRTPVFDRYEILEKIGSGGMGTVYKASDTHLDRWVALKVLPPGLQEHAETLERFKREARALARLKHASVAAVYDANVERGFPYLVMEFVEGENLENILAEKGHLSIPDIVQIGIELAEALQHIHDHRIVHRDVKTANIIIEQSGRGVLADFGIAFVASLPRISRGALGTPEYMSPEQADGKPLDGRTDIYSLGVVLYECLTGHVPFQREGASLAELTALMQHILDDPVPSLKEHRTDVPGWLAEVVASCLSKRPDQRFSCGQDLAEALRQGGQHLSKQHSNGGAKSKRDILGKSSIHGRFPPMGGSQSQQSGTLTLLSHLEPVSAVSFSPNYRHFATASVDRTIRLWDVDSGQLLDTLGPHEGNVLSVAFSPNAAYLASGDVAGNIRLWDTQKGRLMHTAEAHNALALSISFSNDNRHVASGGADGAVRIWDVKKGSLVRTLGGHVGYVLSVAYSPDGLYLASGGADGTIRLCDAKTGLLLSSLDKQKARVICVAFSPDGKLVVAGGADGTVRIWEPGTGKLKRTLRGHRAWVMSAAWSPDGQRIASGSRDHTVCVWERDSGRLLSRLDGHSGPVTSVAYSPDGRYLASSSQDTTVRLWQPKERKRSKRFAVRRFLGLMAFLLLTLGLWRGVPLLEKAWERLPVDTIFQVQQSALIETDCHFVDEPRWTLVVASPKNRPEAEQKVSQYRRDGYCAQIIPTQVRGSTHHRVAVGQFIEETQATRAHQQLADYLPPETWIVQLSATP